MGHKEVGFLAKYYEETPTEEALMYIYQVNTSHKIILHADDGHGDYNRSYERSYDDFDYADYSTDHRDNNFRNYEKKRRKTKKEIIDDLLKRWD